MPRRSKLTRDAIRSVGNVECPQCRTILSPAEYLRVDYERLRCGKCGNDFIPPRKGDGPLDADELNLGMTVLIRKHGYPSAPLQFGDQLRAVLLLGWRFHLEAGRFRKRLCSRGTRRQRK
jgi:ribosomal protein S27AE